MKTEVVTVLSWELAGQRIYTSNLFWACSSALLFLKVTQRKPVWRACIRSSGASGTKQWEKGRYWPFFDLSDLSIGENQLKESQDIWVMLNNLFSAAAKTAISTCFFTWGRALHWRREAGLDGDTDLPNQTSTQLQVRVKHGLIFKEALAKLSALLPWKTNAGILSACIIPAYTCFALLYRSYVNDKE